MPIKQIIFLFCLSLFGAHNVMAQQQLQYGGSSDDIGVSFTPGKYGGYVLLASERTAIDSAEQFGITHVDAQGEIVWRKIIGDIHHDLPGRIEPTSDGGYLVIGSAWDGGPWNINGLLIKLNASGDEVWRSYIGENKADLLYSGRETSDGGYIVSGFSNSDSSFSYGQMYLVKTDDAGQKLWTTYVGGYGKDYAMDVIETADGGYMAIGHFAGFNSYSTFDFTHADSDLLVAKLDANGNEVWSQQYGGAQHELGYALAEADNGNIYLFGSTQSAGNGSFDWLLTVIDPQGNELDSHTYGDIGFDYGKSIDIDSDGNLYLVGSTNTDTLQHSTDLMIIKTQPDGTPIWTQTIGGNGSEYGHFVRAEANGCAIIGSIREENAPDHDVFFLRLDSDGTIQPFISDDSYTFQLFPVPASDHVTFYIDEPNECLSYSYIISDARGAIVYEQSHTSKLVETNVSHLAAGAYYFRISSPCLETIRGTFTVH